MGHYFYTILIFSTCFLLDYATSAFSKNMDTFSNFYDVLCTQHCKYKIKHQNALQKYGNLELASNHRYFNIS